MISAGFLGLRRVKEIFCILESGMNEWKKIQQIKVLGLKLSTLMNFCLDEKPFSIVKDR